MTDEEKQKHINNFNCSSIGIKMAFQWAIKKKMQILEYKKRIWLAK
jgi:hypothetical protein